MKHKFNRLLSRRAFEYGKHIIVVSVRMAHEYNSYRGVDYGSGGRGYYRIVNLKAFPVGQLDVPSESEVCAWVVDEYERLCSSSDVNYDISEESICRIRAEAYDPVTVPEDPSVGLLQRGVCLVSSKTIDEVKAEIRERKRAEKQERFKPAGPIVSLREQLTDAAEPILEKLDTQYEVLNKDVSIDVDVTVEELAVETSWVEVEDEIERLSSEIEELSAV